MDFNRVSKAFGLNEDTWMNHANPWSVYTRYLGGPLLIMALWSRYWLGWYCLIPIGVVILWIFINPLVFPKPKSTNNWASKGTFGERIWLKHKEVGIPQHHLRVANLLTIVSSVSLPFLAYGLYFLHAYATLTGLVIMLLGKSWFIDRMVWLYEDMKNVNEEYKSWEY